MIIVFMLGLVIGSFLGAYTYRWPRSIKISEGRSFCPSCKSKISWYDNIPLLSFVLLGGKCRNCKKKISLRYPSIESVTALLFTTIYLFIENCETGGSGIYSTAVSPVCSWNNYLGWWSLPYLLLLTSILIGIFVTDFEFKLIPDCAFFLLLGIGFLPILSNPEFYKIVFFAFLASGFFLFLNFITLGRGMGLGDVKLVLAMSLAFFEWRMLVAWIFISFMGGALIGILLIIIGRAKFGKQIPFGPFMIVAYILVLTLGDKLAGLLFPF